MPKDYTGTLNLPKTGFSMRANLSQREPEMQKRWEEDNIYEKMLERNQGKPAYILHDGPPFSNGNIHMGTAMNKVLKDFINKYKSMSGYCVSYRPGWDNHGMPIESAIIKQSKLDRKRMTVPEFRNACHDFADKFVKLQMSQFKRLGVLGPILKRAKYRYSAKCSKRDIYIRDLNQCTGVRMTKRLLQRLKLITKMLIVHLFMSSLSCQMILEAISLLL